MNSDPYELNIELAVDICTPVAIIIRIAEDLLDSAGDPMSRDVILHLAEKTLDQAVCRFLAADPLLSVGDVLPADLPIGTLTLTYIEFTDDAKMDQLNHSIVLCEPIKPAEQGAILRELQLRAVDHLTRLLSALEVA